VPTALTVDGLSVHLRPGDDHRLPVVVFVHGAADRAATFARVGRWLPGPDLVRYDRRGYGRSAVADASAPTSGPAVLTDLVDDLAAVIDGAADGRRVVIAGHSVGGLVALAAAGRDCAATTPQVAAVVAFEPPMSWAPWWNSGRTGDGSGRESPDADPGDRMEGFLRRMLGDDHWNSLPAATRAKRRAEGPALVRDLEAARAGGTIELGAIGVPVVFGWGTATSDRHRQAVEEFAALVGGPTEVLAIAGATHGAHLTHPEAFAGLVDAAVATVPSLG
jgi:pimeloyl-ACP methyl ester carboxylesterase